MSLSTIGSNELDGLGLSGIQRSLLGTVQKLGSIVDKGSSTPNIETKLFYLICGFKGSYGIPRFRIGESIEEDLIYIWNEACRFLCFEYLVGKPGNMIDTIGDLPGPEEVKGKEFLENSRGEKYFLIPYSKFIDAISETELGITFAHNITKAWKRKVLGILIIRNFSQLNRTHFNYRSGWMFDGIDKKGNIIFTFDSEYKIEYN